jgi:hypothetical protein
MAHLRLIWECGDRLVLYVDKNRVGVRGFNPVMTDGKKRVPNAITERYES